MKNWTTTSVYRVLDTRRRIDRIMAQRRLPVLQQQYKGKGSWT